MTDRCPNPYCDGYGWIKCEGPGGVGVYWTPACRVGPHPKHPLPESKP